MAKDEYVLQTCGTCGGSGNVYVKVRLVVQGSAVDVEEIRRCGTCNGSGELQGGTR